MRHLAHIVAVAVSIAAAALPAALADPAVRSLVANHPALAAYFPLVSGLIFALYKAWRDTSTPSTGDAPSSGAPTMGAR